MTNDESDAAPIHEFTTENSTKLRALHSSSACYFWCCRCMNGDSSGKSSARRRAFCVCVIVCHQISSLRFPLPRRQMARLPAKWTRSERHRFFDFPHEWFVGRETYGFSRRHKRPTPHERAFLTIKVLLVDIQIETNEKTTKFYFSIGFRSHVIGNRSQKTWTESQHSGCS